MVRVTLDEGVETILQPKTPDTAIRGWKRSYLWPGKVEGTDPLLPPTRGLAGRQVTSIGGRSASLSMAWASSQVIRIRTHSVILQKCRELFLVGKHSLGAG